MGDGHVDEHVVRIAATPPGSPRKTRAPGSGGFALVKGGSPGWTRTSNPAVNSRMLCQLSYGGSSTATITHRAAAFVTVLAAGAG